MKDKIVIYQLLIRLFGNREKNCIRNGSIERNSSGKIKHITPNVLKNLKTLGITHIWYTGLLEHATQTDYTNYNIPIDHPEVVKGKAGSPYAVKDYYDIDPDLAIKVNNRMNEFEQLIKRTHREGLKIIMDFIPNHVARHYVSDKKPNYIQDFGANDNQLKEFDQQNNFYYLPNESLHLQVNNNGANIKHYSEYPAKVSGNDKFDAYPTKNDWYETVKLNYGVDYVNGHREYFTPIPDTWKKMLDILLYWAKKEIDAFRCDMAEMVPCSFWKWVIPQVKEQYPNIEFIAEIYNPNAYRQYIFEGKFDYLYDKVGLYDTLRSIICGNSPAKNISYCWKNVQDIQSHMLNFIENHDEQRIASDFFAKDPKKAFPALVVSACMNTNPMMIYYGQELGERGMDEEGFSGCDGRTTIFDYWSVDTIQRWLYNKNELTSDELTTRLYYQQILNYCNKEKAIREGSFFDLMYANEDDNQRFDDTKIFSFLRQKDEELLLIVTNFDNKSHNIGVRIPTHAFDHLNIKEGRYKGEDLMNKQNKTITLTKDGIVNIKVEENNAIIIKFNTNKMI